MKFTIAATSFTVILSSIVAASPDHAPALRIFRRDDATGLSKRNTGIPQGLFKRQSGSCVNAGYQLCPSTEFCCPAGLACIEGGWCGDEEATTCYAGEDDCGSYCCLEGYRCAATGSGCTALTGTSSSSSSSSGIDTGRKNNSKASQTLKTSGTTENVKLAGGLGAVVAVAIAVAM